jgi:hypothetical protein
VLAGGPGIAFLVREDFILAAVHEKGFGCEERGSLGARDRQLGAAATD